MALCFLGITASAQETTGDSVFVPSGKLWGLVYGDFAYKAKADSLNRGGQNQYTGIRQNQNMFQYRRIYLGYDYKISQKFSAEFLLASEENSTTTATTTSVTSGDLLSDNKISMFVKLANIKWNNIIPGGNLSLGQVYTPSAVLTSEVLWDYRCIERTVSDIRRTPVYDMGARLNGRFYSTDATKLGYNFMVANGTASKPENDGFKWLYGDLYAKVFDRRLVLDIYADYTKINWTPSWHHDRSMLKGIIAYTTPKFTLGTEAFINRLMGDNIATKFNDKNDTLTTKSSAISLFSRGRIYRSILGYFIRFDYYNPSANNNNSIYKKYTPITPTYDPNTMEQFFTAGIDYSPMNKIHIMPNVWYNAYNNAGPIQLKNGYDLVYRLSLYYVYGK
jgi:hypothetical protein